MRRLGYCAPESSSAIVLETLRTGIDTLELLSSCVFVGATFTAGVVTVGVVFVHVCILLLHVKILQFN